MTLEQRLYSMRMMDLAEYALTQFGIKVNKKGSKQKAVEKILAAQNPAQEQNSEVVETDKVPGVFKVEGMTIEELEAYMGMEVDAPEREYYRTGLETYLIRHGYGIKTWEKVPNVLAVKAGKKTIGEVYFGKNTFRINVKEERAVKAGVDFVVIHNYYLPACISKIPYTNTGIILDIFE